MNIKGLVLAGLAWLALGAELAHAAPTILGTYQLWEGPMMGSDSVVLAVPSPTDAWTAMANAGWLHLSGTNQNGTASGTLGFSFDSNSGGTRSGTLTIAGQTLTITQAGATYVPAGSLTSTGSSYTSHGTVTPLVSSGLNQPRGVAVDGVGNLYIADTGNNMIKKWIEANGTVTTLVSSGLNNPFGVAVDGMGNVYIADTGNNAIKEWTIATSNLTTLVTNVDSPYALAVDRSGNVYITDSYDDVVYEWMVGNSNLVTLTSLPVPYICGPPSVAVDIAGNVYYDDTCGGGLDEWTATNGEVYSLTPGWFANPTGVGVGGSGNVYIADQADDWIWEWSAANNALTVAGSGCNRPFGVAVDGSGNVYIADTDNNAIDELPQVLLDPTPRVEGLAAGNDALPVVLPATASLLGVFAPISDQPWLTITGITNGVVGFAFSATTSNRTGTLRLLGHTIPVTQRGPSDSLGRTALLVGPNAGTDSVILDIYPYSNVWTAVANTNWLHLRSTNQSGAGSSIVIFSFDANMGPTRSGTFTIAGQILTVTQAGATYVAAGTLTTLVSSGLVAPNGLAVDGAGNVYIADEYQEAIKKWTASSNILTSLVSGLSGPNSVAVDSAGDNVYFTSGGSILKWAAANNTVTMLVPSGGDLGLDVFGNIYFSDGSTIQEWMVASSNVLTLVSSGGGPLAVDPGGNNVYFNTGTSIQNWTAGNNTVNTVAPLGGNSLAMDGSGNFYSANSDAYDGLYTLQKWTAASNTTTTLVSYHNGLYYGLSGVTVDSTGNVYFADAYNNVIRELPYAFVDSTPKLEGLGAGNDVLPAVLPATENLFAPFSPTSDQSWLEINGVTNGVVSFSFPANLSSPSRTAHIELLNQTITVTQSGPSFSLGVTAVAEAPSAGNDSVVLAVNPSIGIWTATSDSVWLHVSPGNQSGMGSTNVVFSFEANPGLTRFGKLTLANLTLTVTQAGSTYVAAGPLTTLTPSGLAGTYGVAVDNSGRTYIADTYNSMIKEWIPSSNAVATLVSSRLNRPQGVAVDDLGNVYIADTENDAIKEWMTTDSNVTTLVSSGLNRPEGVAVDRVGNVYIADTFHSAVKEWVAANSNVITLASSGLDFPAGVAVDIAGNVYIADTGNNVIKQWTPANNTVTTIVSFGLGYLSGVAVDGAGNVYVADGDNSVIEKWTAATGTLATLVPSGLNGPSGVAVDLAGNTYIADTEDNVVKELPRAFVDPNARLELADAGISALSVVLPVFENLLAPFDPTSDQSWLTISGVTNDAVNFSFTANLGSNRTAHIGLLGQSIPVTQGSPTFSLGTSALLEGPGAGNDSVILAATLKTATWTATTGAGWLHLSAANQSGIGSTNVIFTYDTNPGVTRSGTLTIGGQTLTVTQAGSSYVPAGQMTALVSSGLVFPVCVALDGSGNVYFADYNGNTIEEWTATNNAVTTLVSSGLNGPTWVAVDGVGNIYVADSGNNVIKEWKAANGEIVTLVSSGLNDPNSVALDKAGNVYIADTDNNAIKEWNAANDAVTTVLQDTYLVGAVPDAAGNIYILQSDNGVEEWNSANNTIATLIPSGLNDPNGIAVSGQGNVYIADSFHQVIKEWAATDKAVTTTISSGLSYPYGVAVDGAGNLYIADSAHSEIKELPYTFVDPTPKFEGLAAGNASLPPVLPATANLLPPFAPTSDRSWLTITGITNGIVGFSFSANIGPARTAHISLFGQTIPITQGIVGTPPTVSNVQLLQSGAVQISFTNVAGAAFIVQSTTNLSLPLNEWATVGMPTESPPGQYQFIDSEVTDTQRYYVIRSP